MLLSGIQSSRAVISGSNSPVNPDLPSIEVAAQSIGELLVDILDCGAPICSWNELEFSKHIGRGTSMDVWKGKMKGYAVAIKRLRIQEWPMGPSSVEMGDRKIMRQLKAASLELRAMTHPLITASANVVKLLAISWKEEGPKWHRVILPALAVELASRDYPTLDKLIPTLQVEQLGLRALFLGDILEGLQAIHDCGIVLGDLKPENILIFEESTRTGGLIAKLSDFGFSQSDPDSDSIAGGTAYWNAPECISPEDFPDRKNPFAEWATKKTRDIYSLGLVAVYLLTGEVPFGYPSEEDPTIADINNKKLNDKVSGHVKSILDRHLRVRRASDGEIDLLVPEGGNPASLSESIRLFNIGLLSGKLSYEVLDPASNTWKAADGMLPFGIFTCLGVTTSLEPRNRPLVPNLLGFWGFKCETADPFTPTPGMVVVGWKTSQVRSVEGSGSFDFDRVPSEMREGLFRQIFRAASDPSCDALLKAFIAEWYSISFGVEQNAQEAFAWAIKATQAPARSERAHVQLCHTTLSIHYQISRMPLSELVERRLLASALFYEDRDTFVTVPYTGVDSQLCNSIIESSISTTTLQQAFLKSLDFPLLLDEDFGSLNQLSLNESLDIIRLAEDPNAGLPDHLLKLDQLELLGLIRYACYGRLTRALKRMIQHWPKLLEGRDPHGLKPLQLAVLDEDFSGVSILSRLGADPSCLFETAFIRHVCAWGSNIMVSYLEGVRARAASVKTEYDLKGAIDCMDKLQGPIGESPLPALHGAIQARNLRTVVAMMGTGLNLELPLLDMITPIWMAAVLQQPLVVIALCVHGADALAPIESDGYKLQPLHFVCASGSVGVTLVEKLDQLPIRIDGDAGPSDEERERLRNDLCHSLLHFGNADINGMDSAGMTPMLWCCKRGLLETAKTLILAHGSKISSNGERDKQQKMVDFEVCDANGFTALHHAVLSGNPQLVQMCLDYKPSLSSKKTTDGQTALELALDHGLSQDILELLRRD